MEGKERNAFFVSGLVERINRLASSGVAEGLDGSLVQRDAVLREISLWADEYIRPVHYWEKVRVGDLTCWRCTHCQKVYFLEPPQREYFCPGCGFPMREEAQ